MTETPISVSELLTDPAGVPRARAMLQRAEWAGRAFARYDKPAVDAIVRAAAMAISGLKFRWLSRYCRLPAASARCARRKA